MEDLEMRKRELACSYSTDLELAQSIEYEKIYNGLETRRKDLQESIVTIIALGKGLDRKGKELLHENFLFCMLCRNRVWGLTKLVPDFAADYLTMHAYSEFLNTFETSGISGPEVEDAVGDFISLMKILP